MKKTTVLLIAILLVGFSRANSQNSTVDPAVKFLSSLSEEQKELSAFSFDDTKKLIWSFLPGSMMPRFGIKIKDLSTEQYQLLIDLLKHGLSVAGFNKVQQIMSLEQVLAEIEGNPVFRDPGNYFVAFYGMPSPEGIWAWSFEGHHLSLKFTVTPDHMSVVPRYMGANPAVIPSGDRKGERTLAREEDYGLELIQSMSKEQLKIAVFQEQVYFDIVTQSASEVGPLSPVGILMKDLNRSQQETLKNLISEYLSSLPLELAAQRLNKILNEESDEIRFGWAGSIQKQEGHYYRIQGKSFLVEFDNSLNNANHIHSVWREFDGDFGKDIIREHYRTHEH